MGTKEEVKQRLPIATVIGEYVQLQPAGRGRMKGLCPFHGEKTPSFHVDTEQGYYHCFGCKASGDVFSFVQHMENLSFSEALQKLAHRAGVTLEQRYGEKKTRDLYEVNEFALQYFRKHLKSPSQHGTAYDYLIARGLLPETVDSFQLGYAPDSWDGLSKEAKSSSISERLLMDAGLLSSSESGRVYDRFRGRIIFPIRDSLSRLVGFGGRVLDDTKPKYLNTPETAIFKKGELLYGLDRARTYWKDKHQRHAVIVVEGYMDVIMMHQHGYTQTVASLGTALTAEHSALLQRLGVGEVTLMFDRDEAGLKATLGGLDQTLGATLQVTATSVPTGKDPADALLHGTAAIEQALQNGLDEPTFRVQSALARYGNTTEGKRQILLELAPRMQRPDPLDEGAARLRQLVSDRLELRPEVLHDWLNAHAKSHQKSYPRNATKLTSTQISGMQHSSDHNAEMKLLRAVLVNPELGDQLYEELAWKNEAVRQLVMALKETAPADVLEQVRGRPEEQLLIRAMFEAQEAGTIGRANTQLFRENNVAQATHAARDLQATLSIEAMRQEIERLKALLPNTPPSEQLLLLNHIQTLTRAIEAEKRSRVSRL